MRLGNTPIRAQASGSRTTLLVDRGYETLNQTEYKRRFEPLHPTLEEIFRLISQGKPRDLNENVDCHVSFEGSRANEVAYRSPVCLVSMFMDEVNVCRVSHLLSSYLADVSLETFHPNPFPTSKRKPSGCLIQALGDGVSKVTWVEHSSESGVAYSAKRWISTLERQCERIATLEARDDSLNDKGSGAATNGLLRLAGRMRVDGILIKNWLILDDLQQIPPRVAVSIATSVWLPVKQDQVFNLLRNEQNRAKATLPWMSGQCTHILQGGTADSVAILPSGFVILPDGSTDQSSILTVAFQIIDEELATPQELPESSLITACSLIRDTVSLIQTALLQELNWSPPS
ncbi:hypothetical protein SASPL_139278 [Salvia splendens]|uniref:Homeobox-leucine zipper protein n=1 Tax=Salvia splendens TaxID=180675 RepID=A0A8X8ZBC6_SALSN|nr:hypothetical protein SASPL_139278 [Salvia splendens]